MKLLLPLFTVLAATSCIGAAKIPNLGRGDLHRDLQDFLDLVPINDVVSIVLKYVAEDEQVQNAIEYLQSPEFQNLARDVEALPEVLNLMNYIYDAGVDIYYLVNLINKFIGIEEMVPPQLRSFELAATGGIRGMLDEIYSVLPLDKLEALFFKKLEESKAFKELIDKLSSDEFQTIVNKVYANDKFQKLLKKAAEVGIDLESIKDFLWTILGIKIPERVQL